MLENDIYVRLDELAALMDKEPDPQKLAALKVEFERLMREYKRGKKPPSAEDL